MLFGKSIFQSVVDRLAEEAADEEPPVEPGFRIHGLASGFVPERVDASPLDASRSRDAYLVLMQETEGFEPEPNQDEGEPAVVPPLEPEWLHRLSVEEIGEDLHLALSDDRETLQEKRRQFARINHPDLVAQAFHQAATTRMKIANLLIDEALRRLGPVQ